MVSSLSVSTLPHPTPLEQASASLGELLRVYEVDTQKSIPPTRAEISNRLAAGSMVVIFVGQVPMDASKTDSDLVVNALGTVLWEEGRLPMSVFPYERLKGARTRRTCRIPVVTREALEALEKLNRRIFLDPANKKSRCVSW